MAGRTGSRHKRGQGRGRFRRDQAALPALLLALAGCVGGPGESPAEFFRQVTAADPLFGRAAPPGLDAAAPGLDRVPARPERLSPEAVDALSAQLIRDREAAATLRWVLEE